jgi:hypothetical protein
MTGTRRSAWLIWLAAIVIGVAASVISGLAFPLVGLVCDRIGCVLPSTRRTHDENMAKAEAFKLTFDREVKAGASFNEVESYLNAHGLHFGFVGSPERDNARLQVELFLEKSPNWYCGNGSVGLALYFVNRNLNRTEGTYWSFDCP